MKLFRPDYLTDILREHGVVDRSSVMEPEELTDPCAETGQVPALLKGYSAHGEIKDFDDEKQSFPAVASAYTVDRDGDVILPSAFGYALKIYKTNPVMPWCHNSWFPPVAKSSDWKITKEAFLITCNFSKLPFPTEIYTLFHEGILNTLSVGFLTIAIDREPVLPKQTGLTFTKVELLEISPVVIPSNRQALAQRGQKHLHFLSRSIEALGGDCTMKSARLKALSETFGVDLDSKGFVAVGSVHEILDQEEKGKIEDRDPGQQEYSATWGKDTNVEEAEEDEASIEEDEKVSGADGALPFLDLPLDKEATWNGSAARKRLKAWATEDGSLITEKYAQGFILVKGDPASTSSYYLPIADVFNTEVRAVFRGVVWAMSIINGAKGGLREASEDERRAAYDHVAKYYEKAGVDPPPLKNGPGEDQVEGEEESTPEEDEKVLADLIGKPFPNEHACRLEEPDKYDRFRRSSRQSGGKTYYVIFGKLKGKDTWEQQAFRYKKAEWTAQAAGRHCRRHGGRFEPATDNNAAQAAREEDRMKVRARVYPVPKTAAEALSNVFASHGLDDLFEEDAKMQEAITDCIDAINAFNKALSPEEVKGEHEDMVATVMANCKKMRGMAKRMNSMADNMESACGEDDDGKAGQIEELSDEELAEESKATDPPAQPPVELSDEEKQAMISEAHATLKALESDTEKSQEEKDNLAAEIEAVLREAGVPMEA